MLTASAAPDDDDEETMTRQWQDDYYYYLCKIHDSLDGYNNNRGEFRYLR